MKPNVLEFFVYSREVCLFFFVKSLINAKDNKFDRNKIVFLDQKGDPNRAISLKNWHIMAWYMMCV